MRRITVIKRELDVFLYGARIGTLTGSGTLISGFKYQSGYDGPMLSKSMPVSSRSVGRIHASNWFSGLLPEGEELRRAMAEAHGGRDTTPIGLLEQAGLDCAGAVQLLRGEQLPIREMSFEAISEESIGERLLAANLGQPVADRSERWSVAGQQGKLALHQDQSGTWGKAIGGLPTTHIIKPGITFAGRDSIQDQALTEHLTLSAARALGVPAVETQFHEFNGVPAVIVKRYDRVWGDGKVERVHQEDLCQALRFGPEQKYEDQGGPGVASVASFLKEIAESAEQSIEFRFLFASMVIFNHLTGSPDAHAKNYSILILPDATSQLAPMYDAASGLGYSWADTGKQRFGKSAMKIGHHEQFARVTEADWSQFARDLDLPVDVIRALRDRIAEALPDTFRTLLNGDIPGEARDRLLDTPLLSRMQALCTAART